MTTTPTTQTPSLLASLRQLIPDVPVSTDEAMRVAEAQAERLRESLGGAGDRFETTRIAALPRVRIEQRSLPTSGVTYWDGQHWTIAVNRDEPAARQRFTVLHEYKHIIDHGATTRLYGSHSSHGARAEAAADYFAGCVLMPGRQLKHHWTRGEQSIPALAARFGVSGRAIAVRLWQLGMSTTRERCARPVRSYGDQQFAIVRTRAAA